MKIEFPPQELEYLPLPELIEYEEKKLKETEVMSRAFSSPLYRKKWQAANIKPEKITRLDDLKKLPIINEHDVLNALSKNPANIACSKIRIWFASSGVTGGHKWIPYGDQDIIQMMALLERLGRVVDVKNGDLLLTVTDPSPQVTSAIPYLWAFKDILKTGMKMEIVSVSFVMLERGIDWLSFVIKRQPTILLASPSDAIRLGKSALERASEETESGSKESPIHPKDVLGKLRIGIFYGPLAPYRENIINGNGLDPYEVHTSTEHMAFNVDCCAHDGIHVWMDICIPEIIPLKELEKEKMDPTYRPETVLLADAPSGLEGEYVVTTFGEALPLIRYRTTNKVRVVSTKKCHCGRTHPRISFLERVIK